MAVARFDPDRRRVHVALFDATTLTAKGVKEQLIDRSFPVASLQAYTSSDDPESNLTEFKGEAMIVTAPDIEALGRLDIAFLCGTRREGMLYLDWPERKGFVAIDLTSAASQSAEVPLVNASVNPQTIEEGPRLIATPHPIGLFLSSLLAPIRNGCGLIEATIVVLQPASEGGEAGIEELYKQTVGLLNFQEVPCEVFGRQLAFNLIPSFLRDSGKDPVAPVPSDLESEVSRVTGGGYHLAVEVIQAPVFHCHAALARVVLPEGMGQRDLVTSFKDAEGIRVGRDGAATPVDRAGKSGTIVTGIRPAGKACAFWIWGLCDDLRSGTALNAVRIAEVILERRSSRSES